MPSSIFRIGCQSWGYDDWITPAAGPYVFYPQGTRRDEMLPFYSKVFDTVEVDATLYGIPPVSTIEKWVGDTPDGFLFSLKTPRDVTHDGRLSPGTVPVMKEFIDRAHLLREKFGMILIQLPPSFDGTSENARNLRNFLQQLPTGVKYAVEFRHSDWFIDWTFQELESSSVSLALVEGPWLPRQLMFDSIPKLMTDFSYIRIMGERDLEKFDRPQRDRGVELGLWATALQDLNGTETFVYIDNYFEGFAPATAAGLQELLGLPARNAEEFREQPSLFD